MVSLAIEAIDILTIYRDRKAEELKGLHRRLGEVEANLRAIDPGSDSDIVLGQNSS